MNRVTSHRKNCVTHIHNFQTVQTLSGKKKMRANLLTDCTNILSREIKGAEEVHIHLGAADVHTLLWHVRFLIRGFMHKAATNTLCFRQRDHIGLRTVPPSYNCRPDRKSLIFATEQKFWNFFLKLPHELKWDKVLRFVRFLGFGAKFQILHVHA